MGSGALLLFRSALESRRNVKQLWMSDDGPRQPGPYLSGGRRAEWGEAAQREQAQELLREKLPETRDRLRGSPTADSDKGTLPSPTELTNGREANLVLFVSHFQALIKIICSDCLGKLFFAPPFPSLYQCHFRGSRFPGEGVQTALCRLGGRQWGLTELWEQSQTSWQPVRWES